MGGTKKINKDVKCLRIVKIMEATWIHSYSNNLSFPSFFMYQLWLFLLLNNFQETVESTVQMSAT